MKNISTDLNKENLNKLGLMGKDFINQYSSDHLFLDDWVITSKREKGFYPTGLPWSDDNTHINFFLDEANSYYINSLGFRGQEFDGNNKLVFSGCSFTFGLGLPEDAIWGSQIAKKINLSYSNLGLLGDSVVSIITNIYKYFEEYGHPKVLLCLFPDFYRFLIPINSDRLITKYNFRNEKDMLSPAHILYQESDSYSKAPNYAENVFSPDLPFFYSYQYIRMLEKYCEQAGILFFWSTWSGLLNNVIVQQKNISKNFINLESDKWTTDKDSGKDIFLDKCNKHEYLRQQYPNCFDMSTDIENEKYIKKRAWHSGVHKHTHWAEKFLEKINKQVFN